ncbi:MAG: hypothetical protein RR701_07335 [Comamonas sp.]
MSKNKSGLIAMVATAVIVDGVRTVIQPGEELPELPEHDEKELLESGAALDPEAQAAAEKARNQEEQFAQQAFQEARERAMAERASTAVVEPASDQDSTVVVDGEKTNTKFPDISELDQAHGRVSLSEVHQAATDTSAAADANKASEPAAKGGKKTNATKE